MGLHCSGAEKIMRHFSFAAMAIALLLQTEQIFAKDPKKYVMIGELYLNGRIRPYNGILPMDSVFS